METFEELFTANREILNSLSPETWIKILKETTIAFKQHVLSDNEKSAIMDAKSIVIKYDDFGLCEITIIVTSKDAYEDYKIELNTMFIVISQQKGHSKFEELSRIPIAFFRVIDKYKS